jgi:hypothetical protein
MKPTPRILAASLRTALGLLALSSMPVLPVLASPPAAGRHADGQLSRACCRAHTVQYSVTPLEHDLRRYTQRSSMPVRVGEQEISYAK